MKDREAERDELIKITNNLPPVLSLSDFVLEQLVALDVKNYQIEGGILTAVGLYKNEKVAIVLISTPGGGAVMPLHAHDEDEWFAQISGRCEVTIDGGRPKRLLYKDWVFIPAKTPHVVKYIEPGKQWVITMPANPDFPEGRR